MPFTRKPTVLLENSTYCPRAQNKKEKKRKEKKRKEKKRKEKRQVE